MLFMKDELQILVETTGGYNSTNNGKAESPHKHLKKTTHVLLISANKPDKFWCFVMHMLCSSSSTHFTQLPNELQFNISQEENMHLLQAKYSHGDANFVL